MVVMGALGETFYLLSNQVIVGIDNYNNNDKDNLQRQHQQQLQRRSACFLTKVRVDRVKGWVSHNDNNKI